MDPTMAMFLFVKEMSCTSRKDSLGEFHAILSKLAPESWKPQFMRWLGSNSTVS